MYYASAFRVFMRKVTKKRRDISLALYQDDVSSTTYLFFVPLVNPSALTV